MSKDLVNRTSIPASVQDVFELRTSDRWVALK